MTSKPRLPCVCFFALSVLLLGMSHQALGSCTSLGVVKVKVGGEHCGYQSQENKESSLSMACTLAEQRREELLTEAQEKQPGCQEEYCEGRFRPWANIYTHVFSQNCWAECGWSWVVECTEPEPEEALVAEQEPPGAQGSEEPPAQ